MPTYEQKKRCKCFDEFTRTIESGTRPFPYRCTLCGRIFVADQSQIDLAKQLMPAIIVHKALYGLVIHVPPNEQREVYQNANSQIKGYSNGKVRH